jgi:hypothetical protein
MTAQEATDTARRKSRYGHRQWIVWREPAGEYRAELATAANLKRAMLDTGTQGKFWGWCADGCPTVLRWGMAVVWWRNSRLTRADWE